MVYFKSTGWVRAIKAGLFTWSRSSGAIIKKGEPIGTVNSPQGDLTAEIVVNTYSEEELTKIFFYFS